MAAAGCFLCHRSLKPSDRRTLGSSEKGRTFLETFVGVPSSEFMQPQCHYLCKPCLKKLERGKDVVDDLQQLVSRSRQHFGLPDVLIKTSTMQMLEVSDGSAK